MSVGIGERIRALRTERGLSQEEVARRTGVSLGSYGDIERGVTTDPHYSTLRGISHALGVPIDQLLQEEPVPLDEASQETRRLEEERRKVEDKVEELVALGRGEADPYQVQWALDEAQDCWLTLLLALPGSRWEGNRIVSEFNPFSMDKSQWEQREQAENARRFYYEILGRLMEAGLVELRERPGQNAEPVAVGIGA